MHEMKRFTKRTRILLGVIAACAALAAVGAYAYWTASGTGSGTASVGTDSGVSIVVTDTGSALYPGGSATITFHVHNNSTTSSVEVGKVVQDGPVTGLTGGCSASDFSFADVTLNETVAASGDGADKTGTLSMANTGSNQDACKTQSPVLHLKTDNSGL
jgi:hypothetical protein